MLPKIPTFWRTAVYHLDQVLCKRACYRSQTCLQRAHPLGLPLSARLDSALSNILLPARCLWCAEFCMRGCKYLEWERERKVLLERWERDQRDKRGEKMGGKMSEKIGRKMGEERYEGERETAHGHRFGTPR